MPFVSKAQNRWMRANHPEMAKRWAKHTKSIKALPEKVDGEEKKAEAERHLESPAGGKRLAEFIASDPKGFAKQLAKGVVVEREHTSNPKERASISLDHISDDEGYYTDLIGAGLGHEMEGKEVKTAGIENLVALLSKAKKGVGTGLDLMNPVALGRSASRLSRLNRDASDLLGETGRARTIARLYDGSPLASIFKAVATQSKGSLGAINKSRHAAKNEVSRRGKWVAGGTAGGIGAGYGAVKTLGGGEKQPNVVEKRAALANTLATIISVRRHKSASVKCLPYADYALAAVAAISGVAKTAGVSADPATQRRSDGVFTLAELKLAGGDYYKQAVAALAKSPCKDPVFAMSR